MDVTFEHLVTGCHNGRVEAINVLARARVQCELWPEWQRYDGSIIYEKLPESVKNLFKRKYLDGDGYVDVESLHIMGKDFLVGCAEARSL